MAIHSTVLVQCIWMNVMWRFGAWCRGFLVVSNFHWSACSCCTCLCFLWGFWGIPILVLRWHYVQVWEFCDESFPVMVARVAIVVLEMHCYTLIFIILILHTFCRVWYLFNNFLWFYTALHWHSLCPICRALRPRLCMYLPISTSW